MSNTIFRDQNSVTTILAIRNQLAANLGISFTVDKTTTINTKRGVLANDDPTSFPKIRYFGIGIKGYANLTSEDNIAQPYMPSAEDCDLFEPIPFRVVPVESPLDSDEEAQYRIRTTLTKDGREYYAYWLKKIVFESTVAKTTKIVDGVESDYQVSASNLNPIPNDLYPSELSDAENRIVASVVGVCRVTGAEIKEVADVLYGGDMRRMRISEFGTYSGCEKSVSGGRTEAAYVQLCTHKCTLGQTLSDEHSVLIERKVFEAGSCVVI